MVKIIINLLMQTFYKLVKDMDLIHLFHFYITVIKINKRNHNLINYQNNSVVNKFALKVLLD